MKKSGRIDSSGPKSIAAKRSDQILPGTDNVASRASGDALELSISGPRERMRHNGRSARQTSRLAALLLARHEPRAAAARQAHAAGLDEHNAAPTTRLLSRRAKTPFHSTLQLLQMTAPTNLSLIILFSHLYNSWLFLYFYYLFHKLVL